MDPQNKHDKIKKLERKYKLLDSCDSKRRLEDFILLISRMGKYGEYNKDKNGAPYEMFTEMIEIMRNSELTWNMRSDVRSTVQIGGSGFKD